VKKDLSTLPYHPAVLRRLQRIAEEKRRQNLTPRQQVAQARLEALLTQEEKRLGMEKAELQEPLTEEHQKAFDLICTRGPLTGKEVVNRLGIASESLFTGRSVPELRTRGIRNRRGLGYYHPDFYKPGPKPVGKT